MNMTKIQNLEYYLQFLDYLLTYLDTTRIRVLVELFQALDCVQQQVVLVLGWNEQIALTSGTLSRK